MFSVCLPSDALLQHLPSYLGFSYLGCGLSLQGCSRKAQPLLLTLDEGYLLTTTPSDLERGLAPLSPLQRHTSAGGWDGAQSWPKGATPCPRSGAEAGRTPCPRGSSQEELLHIKGQGQKPRVPACDGSGRAERSYSTSEVKEGGSLGLHGTDQPQLLWHW